MSWQGIHGHDRQVAQFRRAAARGRLAGAYLFVGPEGIGKRASALKLAQALLCQTRDEVELDPCGACPPCVQAAALTHPDLHLVSKPAGRSTLLIELFIGAAERRGREGLCHSLAHKPLLGRRKVGIIDDADFLAADAANCLLKTLEEPPPGSVLILIGASLQKQLPTIRSRCQVVRFGPLPEETVAEILVSQGLVEDEAEAKRLAGFSEGSVAGALELADPDLWKFRGELLQQLARGNLNSVSLAQRLVAFIEQAGTEASAKRNRAKQAIRFAADFYRQLMRAKNGGAKSNGDECLDRSLEALQQIDRNAHVVNVVECWLDDLAQISGGVQIGGG